MNKKIQAALTAGMAAIIGVLAVLGVEGDVLDRFIRDHPQRVAIVLTIAVVGVLMPLMRLGASDAATGKRITRLGPLLPPLLVGLAASLAIWFGAAAVGDREQPDVDVRALSIDGDEVRVEVVATATHLRSSDRMLTRVATVAAPTRQAADEIRPSCTDPNKSSRDIDVAFWGESGPDLKGDAATTATVAVSRAKVRFLCVYAGLSRRSKTSSSGHVDTGDDRLTTAVVDLDTIGIRASQP